MCLQPKIIAFYSLAIKLSEKLLTALVTFLSLIIGDIAVLLRLGIDMAVTCFICIRYFNFFSLVCILSIKLA